MSDCAFPSPTVWPRQSHPSYCTYEYRHVTGIKSLAWVQCSTMLNRGRLPFTCSMILHLFIAVCTLSSRPAALLSSVWANTKQCTTPITDKIDPPREHPKTGAVQ